MIVDVERLCLNLPKFRQLIISKILMFYYTMVGTEEIKKHRFADGFGLQPHPY